MTTWADLLTDLVEVQLAAFGEPVILPSGAETTGIFDLPGDAPSAPWSEVGLAVRISHQPNPHVALPDAVAAALEEQEALGIRGASYLISRKRPSDGSGLTTLELMPDNSQTTELARWR